MQKSLKDKKDISEENNRKITRKIYFNESLIFLLLLSLGFAGLGKIGLYNNLSIFGKISEMSLIFFSVVGVIPVLFGAIKSLSKKEVTIDLLASIALIFTLLQGQWISAVFINLMLASASLFSAFTERRTENIISRLLKLKPSKVKVQVGEKVVEKTLDEILVGDIVVVEAGDRVPVDGIVTQGVASVDQSSLTGESVPVSKKEGSQVWSSTLCVSGSLFVRAEKVGEDTTLAKMIKLVDEASRAKTKTETLASKFSAWYISLTLVGVVVLYIFTQNLNLILAILLVTCADDLAVAIPLGFTVAISKAAKHGIVVKGSAVMERVKDIKIIVTDKTGTLTKGLPTVNKMIVLGDLSENKLLKIGATCAVDSKHPAAKAILEYAKEKGEEPHAPDEITEKPGEGVFVRHDGNEYLSGKISFLANNGVYISSITAEKIKEEQRNGFSVTALAINKKVEGLFVLSDSLRKYAKEVVAETRSLGVKNWVMLTGDNEEVAKRVSKEIGIDEFHANLKPADKLDYVKKLKHRHGSIAMMGDGVNDAAALALADVSFAMGAIGSDASIDAADIALMHDDLRRVPEAILLSKESIKIVKQNFIIWALTNGVGLYLALNGVLNPVTASLYNFLTDFVPILNVFKIYNLKINKHTYDNV